MNNFKTVTVNGYTRNEAIENAPFQVIKDATQAWKNNGKPMPGTNEFKEFCAEYLNGATKFANGIGCSVTMEAGAPDTRERPYEVVNVKNEKGKRKFVSAYQVINPETNEILYTSHGTKKEAIDEAKKFYADKGYRGKMVGRCIKEVVEGEPMAFTLNYAPSKSAKLGTYVAFGVEA